MGRCIYTAKCIVRHVISNNEIINFFSLHRENNAISPIFRKVHSTFFFVFLLLANRSKTDAFFIIILTFLNIKFHSVIIPNKFFVTFRCVPNVKKMKNKESKICHL